MYVTRPLSLYRRHPYLTHPEVEAEPPPEGPNSGILLISDNEEVEDAYGPCGYAEYYRVRDLPFPQNKIMNIVELSNHGYDKKMVFVPAINQPLSSNRYYVIFSDGAYKGYVNCRGEKFNIRQYLVIGGQASTCSTDEDALPTCCGNFINDVQPRVLNFMDDYQILEINQSRRGRFNAKSVAPDGHPQHFLRSKDLRVTSSISHKWQLGEAHGVDSSLRLRMPEFDFPISNGSSSTVVVGKWYCPFMFIKEMRNLKVQMKKSMFYVMTLEQRWEEIHLCVNDGTKGSIVAVDINLQRERSKVFGEEAMEEDTHAIDGVLWFRPLSNVEVGNVGLSWAIIERMRWEEERVGWEDTTERSVTVERVDEFGSNEWHLFGCYVLVETFALKRMDGSLVLTYDYIHTHRIQSKWE